MNEMSMRAFARHMGVTHRAVQKAVQSGRIQLTANGKVDGSTAEAAWRRNTDEGRRSFVDLSRKTRALEPSSAPPPADGEDGFPAAASPNDPHMTTYRAARAQRETTRATREAKELERDLGKACIDRYDRPHTLFYLDPPYWETEGYGVEFPFEEYVEMARRLKAIKGKAIASLNEHPAIREAFADFHIETVDIKYTAGGGWRETARSDVIIFSWDDAA